jgi:hypothetical protein
MYGRNGVVLDSTGACDAVLKVDSGGLKLEAGALLMTRRDGSWADVRQFNQQIPRVSGVLKSFAVPMAQLQRMRMSSSFRWSVLLSSPSNPRTLPDDAKVWSRDS